MRNGRRIRCPEETKVVERKNGFIVLYIPGLSRAEEERLVQIAGKGRAGVRFSLQTLGPFVIKGSEVAAVMINLDGTMRCTLQYKVKNETERELFNRLAGWSNPLVIFTPRRWWWFLCGGLFGIPELLFQ